MFLRRAARRRLRCSHERETFPSPVSFRRVFSHPARVLAAPRIARFFTIGAGAPATSARRIKINGRGRVRGRTSCSCPPKRFSPRALCLFTIIAYPWPLPRAFYGYAILWIDPPGDGSFAGRASVMEKARANTGCSEFPGQISVCVFTVGAESCLIREVLNLFGFCWR